MFTGIIQEIGTVVSVRPDALVIGARKTLPGLQNGGSFAVNGVCLTVTAFDAQTFTANIMAETLRRTNLGSLRRGDRVNLERPLGLGGEVGGHLVQGHVDGTGEILSLQPEGDAVLMRVTAPEDIMRFTVPKGFIAVDGASLTIVDRDETSFRVSLVTLTLAETTFGEKQRGDRVNLEADIIGKYVAQFQSPQGGRITFEFLQENGFMVN